MSAPQRRSPVEALIASASRPPTEFGLEDLSRLPKIGLLGPGVADWLSQQGLPWPERIFDTTHGDDGSILARIGMQELVIESLEDDGLVRRVAEAGARRTDGVYLVEQQTATFVVGEPAASGVWAQTCGLNVPELPLGRISYTRVAGVSCGIIPQTQDGRRRYRIWVDYGYAPDLWRTFVEISQDLVDQAIPRVR